MSSYTFDQIEIMQDGSISVKDAAKRVGCSETTVRKYRKAALITPAQFAESAQVVEDADVILSITKQAEPWVRVESDWHSPICGHRTQGSKFMCGLSEDHKDRNIGHCYGIPVPA